jgi:hypothetical protein
MAGRRNCKIDAQIEESFPASDPPSFMGGEVLGAPPGRSTPPRRTAVRGRSQKKPAAKKKKRATKKRKSR